MRKIFEYLLRLKAWQKISLFSFILIIAIFAWLKENKTTDKQLLVKPHRGNFEVQVLATGELRAKHQTEISAPMSLRNNNVYQIKINDLVAEGTRVKEGDVVGSLDPTEIMTKLNEAHLNLAKKMSEFKQTTLDTTLTLREAREDLVNCKFGLEQSRLVKQQSIYEAPAVREQVELDYQKQLRSFEEKQKNYQTKVEQAKTKIQIVQSDLTKEENNVHELDSIINELRIKAPKAGMVIYVKDWSGRKKSAGSTLNMWDPILAALPDLNNLETVTYINEVDIQKIKIGLPVSISLDAMPSKQLQGKVSSIANIGEQKPNSDAKVFEVIIDVLTTDSVLRPAMTTGCKISSETYANALSVPLETIHTANKNTYVFLKKGGKLVKQQVKIETVNETAAMITNGIHDSDELFESLPADTAGLPFVTIDKLKEEKPKRIL